jgi:predicted XRE-type DNA-binding protein
MIFLESLMLSEWIGANMSKTKWPSKSQIKEMREKLSRRPASRPLHPAATPIDKIKHDICREFVVYKNSSKITQKALAAKIGIDEALMSKILHYNIDEFTIDRLLKFLTTLRPNARLKFEVA